MVSFKYNEKEYNLTFTRETAKEAERRGLQIDTDVISEMPLNSFDTLAICSFEANHPELTEDERLEIIAKLNGKGNLELYKALYKEFAQTFESLLGEPDEKNAIKWEVK